jgi:hypothetical protein
MARKLEQLGRDIQRIVEQAARQSAVNIMNDLAEAGPVWSGEFQNSWVAVPGKSGAGSKGSYPYSLSDVPELNLTLAGARSAVLPNGKTFTIENTQPYAAYALDLEEGVFRGIGFAGSPEGQIVAQGTRSSGKRGDVTTDAEGEAISTAPLDWYTTYVNGGEMARALELGIKTAFKP